MGFAEPSPLEEDSPEWVCEEMPQFHRIPVRVTSITSPLPSSLSDDNDHVRGLILATPLSTAWLKKAKHGSIVLCVGGKNFNPGNCFAPKSIHFSNKMWKQIFGSAFGLAWSVSNFAIANVLPLNTCFQSWMWLGLPLFLFACDTLYSYCRRHLTEAQVVGITRFPGNILQLHLVKKHFHIRPGQVRPRGKRQKPFLSPFQVAHKSQWHGELWSPRWMGYRDDQTRDKIGWGKFCGPTNHLQNHDQSPPNKVPDQPTV